MFQEITDDSLANVVSENDIVLVQYSAGWCGNCRIMKPKFKKMASDNDSIPFLMVDAEKNPNSRALANVDNLPTFAAFKNGELLKQIQTNKTELLKEFVDEITSN
jgi:thiol-disulfide isomerase/thioredoxin